MSNLLLFMRWSYWDLLPAISMVGWLLGLGAKGLLAPELIAISLVCLLSFLVIKRVFGGLLGRRIRFVFHAGIPIASLLTLWVHFQSNSLTMPYAILFTMLVVILSFVAFLTVLKKDFSYCGGRYSWDMPAIISAAVLMSGLVVSGRMSLEIAALFFIAISAMLIWGRHMGGRIGRIVRLGFRVGLPITSIATIVTLIEGGDLYRALSAVIVLFIVLIALFVMLAGVLLTKS